MAKKTPTEPLYLIRLRKRVEKLRAYLIKEFPDEEGFDPFSCAHRQRIGFRAGLFIEEIDRFLDEWKFGKKR